MGVKVFGVEELVVNIRNIGAKASKAARSEMMRQAEAVQDLARRGSPREFGDLESAIKIHVADGGRDAFGRFVRQEIEIYIDGSMLAPHHPGHYISEYAIRMHEGDYELGYESQQKQLADPEVEVGPKFLERAGDELAPKVVPALEIAVRRTLD